jgi:Tfp pilus assembly protein PilN
MNILSVLQQYRPRLTNILPAKRMLALDLSGRLLCGAVVGRRGRRLVVENFVSVDRGKQREDLPDQAHIAEIMDRLDYSSGEVVLVTPLVRAVQISMNRLKVEKLRHYQLCDALRWEVEPYTGISGVQALVGAVRGVPSEQEDLMLITEDEEEIDVSISVIERNVYRAVKQICRRCGLKLVRLYPPEACFYMPLFLEAEQAPQAVFEIGVDYAHFAFVRAGLPKQISTVPLGRDVLLEMLEGDDPSDAANALRFILDQVPGPLPLVLTGIGATRRDLIDHLDGLCPHGARPIAMTRHDKLGRAEHDALNAMYAVAVGGAVRELCPKRFRRIGISDKVPLDMRLRQSAYLVPLVVTGLLAAGLFGHYGYMKHSREQYQARNAELQSEIKARQKSHDEFQNLKKQIEETRAGIRLVTRQLGFLEGGSDGELEHLERVLQAMFAMPEGMLLDVLQQQGEEVLLQGRARNVRQVGEFAVGLQQHHWCRVAELLKVAQHDDVHITFEIRLLTSIEAGS